MTPHQYRGDLAQTELPEILYSIARFKVGGVIEASRDNVVKRIYLSGGRVVHANSSSRADSLGEYLRRVGKLSLDELVAIARQRDEANRRFGVLLCERRLLSPAEVYEAVRDHVEEIVWSLFLWDEGEVTFTISRDLPSSSIQIYLPLRRVIFQGIKKLPNPKELIARLGNRKTIVEPDFDGEDLIEVGLSADEYELLHRVDGKRNLYDLCAEGPLSPRANARLLYAFQVLRLVRKAEAEAPARDASGVTIRLRSSGGQFDG